MPSAFRGLRDLVDGEGTARDFDHGADLVAQLHLLFLLHFRRDAVDDGDLQIQFLLVSDERNHDLGLHLDAFLLHLGNGFENRARLRLGDLGIRDAEAAAAVPEHRVELMQCSDTGLHISEGDAEFLP